MGQNRIKNRYMDLGLRQQDTRGEARSLGRGIAAVDAPSATGGQRRSYTMTLNREGSWWNARASVPPALRVQQLGKAFSEERLLREDAHTRRR